MILASEQLIKEWTSKGAWIEKTLIDYFKVTCPPKTGPVFMLGCKHKAGLMRRSG